MNNLGNRIKALRLEKEWSQKKLGMKLGKSDKIISLYELGERMPSPDTLRDIAILFGVSVDYLLNLEKPSEISLEQLTIEQQSTVRALVMELRKLNGKKNRAYSSGQIEVIGEILRYFSTQ